MISLNSLLAITALTAGFAHAQVQGIWFINEHSNPMHISPDWARDNGPKSKDNRWLEPGARTFFQADTNTNPKYFIGPVPNNNSPRVKDRRDHNTVVEATFGGPLQTTFFDIDIEKGFSVPVWCRGASEAVVDGEGCLEDLLIACPERDMHFDNDTGIYDYCEGRGTAESLAVRVSLCPNIYVIHDDLATKTLIKNGDVIECTIANPKVLPWIGPRVRPVQY